MNRLGSLFWLTLAVATGFTMFMVKYAVQNLEDELGRVRKRTVAAQAEIRVLNAEWSYLTQPERLADLNKQFVSLAPIATKQLQQSLDTIPLRAPPEPPAEMSAQAPPPPPPVPSLPENYLPVTPVALSAASQPVAPNPAIPRPRRPQRGIDDLFAQIAAGDR